MASEKKESRTRALAAKVIFAALSSLKEAGKGIPIKELITVVGDKVNLNEWEEEVYPKSKNPRWVAQAIQIFMKCAVTRRLSDALKPYLPTRSSYPMQ